MMSMPRSNIATQEFGWFQKFQVFKFKLPNVIEIFWLSTCSPQGPHELAFSQKVRIKEHTDSCPKSWNKSHCFAWNKDSTILKTRAWKHITYV